MTKRSKPLRIPDQLRNQIGDEIAVGHGRNDIARRHGVSPGFVSKVARERGLGFRNAWMVDTAVHARQIDLWKQRVEKAEELDREHFAIIKSLASRNPEKAHKRSRREKKITYAIYDLDRHHNGVYKAW